MIYISDLCVWLAINKVTTYRNRFYAENATVLATPDYFSEFVIQTVVPLLNGGYCKMPYAEIAKKLCFWVESFEGNVKMCGLMRHTLTGPILSRCLILMDGLRTWLISQHQLHYHFPILFSRLDFLQQLKTRIQYFQTKIATTSCLG